MKLNGVNVSNRTLEYLETILWSETVNLPVAEEDLVDGCMDVDEDHILHGVTDCEPLDKWFGFDDFTEESLRKAEKELNDWFDWLDETDMYDAAAEYADDGHIAHDFWLTRNGHGAGYWDGDYGDELGRALTAGCKAWSEQYVCIGDDGKLHLEG